MYSAPNHCASVTASDTVKLPRLSDWLSFVNSGAQTIQISDADGNKVNLGALPSGMYPIRATQVWSTNTSVTSITMWWL